VPAQIVVFALAAVAAAVGLANRERFGAAFPSLLVAVVLFVCGVVVALSGTLGVALVLVAAAAALTLLSARRRQG
jgi:hypothetical protein